jgi:hypothetical protein
VWMCLLGCAVGEIIAARKRVCGRGVEDGCNGRADGRGEDGTRLRYRGDRSLFSHIFPMGFIFFFHHQRQEVK